MHNSLHALDVKPDFILVDGSEFQIFTENNEIIFEKFHLNVSIDMNHYKSECVSHQKLNVPPEESHLLESTTEQKTCFSIIKIYKLHFI